jgi:hypothetical protein
VHVQHEAHVFALIVVTGLSPDHCAGRVSATIGV